MINKDELKEELTEDQIFELLEELGGEPQMFENHIVAKTICHGGHSHKLYYYFNTQLFKCYTDCGDSSFDIFELIIKIKKNTVNEVWTLPQAMYYVATYFGIPIDYQDLAEHQEELEDWKIFDLYDKRKVQLRKKTVEYKIYDESILKNLPFIPIIDWNKEHITNEIMKIRGIRYYPTQEVILIPHYNIDNKLIGIRQRTLFKEEEKNGKYKPAIIQGKMYNHPLGSNLYNLNNSKENIKSLKKAIVFESEKSCLQYASWMGIENDISVACCGSALIEQQVQLLYNLGVEEIIIGMDKQFQEVGDKEWEKLTKNFYNINNKYGKYVLISYLFDKNNLLDYKDSPSDKGKEVFLELFKNRIVI